MPLIDATQQPFLTHKPQCLKKSICLTYAVGFYWVVQDFSESVSWQIVS